jgi:hypothetical protein
VKLYGLTEIAQALGMDRRVLAVWRQRGKLPKPDAELAAGPVWSARRVEPWMENVRAGKISSPAGEADAPVRAPARATKHHRAKETP